MTMSAKYFDKFVLDEHGEPRPEPDLRAWAEWMETQRDRRIVAWERILIPAKVDEAGNQTQPAVEQTVSTVFLGLNHAWDEHAPPLLFETLVFNGPLADTMERYATLAEARLGHAHMVERVLAYPALEARDESKT